MRESWDRSYAGSCTRTSENTCSRNCPKSPDRALSKDLRAGEMRHIGLIWPSYEGKEGAQSKRSTPTPFRTVSLGSWGNRSIGCRASQRERDELAYD
jgi:hypothetical protein